MSELLYLVDGMSHVYRAYYAIRGLATTTGIPTNATFGFTMMLRRILADHKPEFIAVAFDSPEPTFRHESYSSYKSTRQAPPDELLTQLPYIERACRALGVPIIRLPGYEADDIIGTLAKEAERAGFAVFIVTNDKDLFQLVGDKIKVLRAERSGALTLLDAKGVQERLGVRPDQVVDMLALWGDPTDNIPGAPGIGEKGAQQLIQQFGTLDQLLAQADQIERKTYRESVKKNVEQILKSRELARIRCNAPIEFDPQQLRYRGPDRAEAYRLFSELEFSQLAREFSDAAPKEAIQVAAARAAAHNYRRISSPSDLDQLIRTLWSRDRLALAAAERNGELSAIAISTEPGEAALLDLEKLQTDPDPLLQMRELLENGLVRKYVHDWKGILAALENYFERRSLAKSKPNPDGRIFDFEPTIKLDGIQEDTMLAAYLLDPNRTSPRLATVAREFLNAQPEERIPGFDQIESEALQSADMTFQLAPILAEKIRSLELERVYREIELPLVEVLFEMERIGVRVDVEALKRAGLEMERQMERLSRQIYELAGREFNINSPAQLAEIFHELKFDIGRKTKTGRISTSAEALEELAARHELPRLVLEYRELSKLKGTYVDALPKLINPRTGRLHTTFNQAATATGRLSSTNPNLQNIPIRSEMGQQIRAAFVPSPGYLLMSADYSQIELRIFAHMTGDPAMTEAFRRGKDIHAETARAVFGAKTKEEEAQKRRLAKIVNFAIAYAVGAFGLAERTGLTRAEAKRVIENYYNTYKGVRRYMEETPKQVRKTGLTRTLLGRIRPIPEINNRNQNIRARAEREAINAPLQGTTADLVKMAMIAVRQKLRAENLGAKLLLQVHDELLFEVPEAELQPTRELVRHQMESIYKLSVPLRVNIGIGRNWMEAKA